MRDLRAWGPAVLAAALALALTGCGDDSSGSEQESSAQTTLELESPGVQPNGVVSPRVVCGSGTIWMPLKWSGIPSDAEELILYFGRYTSEDVQGSPQVDLTFAATVAEIDPELNGMAANTYPEGAQANYYVSIENCPPVREGQKFLVELFALPRTRGIPQNDDNFAIRLAEEALGVKDFATESESASEFRDEALATGHFTATYGPPS